MFLFSFVLFLLCSSATRIVCIISIKARLGNGGWNTTARDEMRTYLVNYEHSVGVKVKVRESITRVVKNLIEEIRMLVGDLSL